MFLLLLLLLLNYLLNGPRWHGHAHVIPCC